MPDIENLTIQISANETQAVDGLAKLARTLERLKQAVNGAAPTKSEANRLRDFGQALNSLRGAENIRISSTIATQISRIGRAIHDVAEGDVARLRGFVDALRGLEGLGNVALPNLNANNIGQQITQAVSDAAAVAPTVEMEGGIQESLENDLENIANEARDANGEAENLRNTLVSMEAVDAFARNISNTDMLIMRLSVARDRLQELLSAEEGRRNLGAIANTTQQVQALQEALQSATQESGGFVGVISGIASTIGGGLVSGLRGAISGVFGFISSIARIAKYRFIRTLLKDMGQSFKDLYGYSKLFGVDFAGSMDKINTALVYLRNSIAAMVAPLVNALAPAVDFIVDKFVALLNLVNEFFAAIGGQDTYTVAKKVAKTWESSFDSTGKSAKSAKDKADELKRTLLGFDEINKLDKPKASTTSGGSGSGSSPYTPGYETMFEERNVTGGIKAVGDSLSRWVSTEIGKIEAIIDASAFAIGLILATHGQPLIGIGMMAGAALNAGANVVAYSDTITPEIKAAVAGIMGIAGIGFAVGAVLAFASANIPLGLGLLVASIGALSGSYDIVSVNWNAISELLRGPIGTITALVSGSLLAVGAILTFSSTNIPLGIGLMIAGAAGLAPTVAANWNAMTEQLRGPLGAVTALASGASLALGILALVGGAIPLGIGLIIAGAAGLVRTVAANWDNIINLGKTAFKKLKEGWDSLAQKALELTAVIATKAQELWAAISAGWSNLRDKVVTFAAKVANGARTWWGNVQAWWSETRDKVVTFAAKVANGARTWWSNVQTWWSETRDKIVTFAAKVANDARTWWGNVQAWWGEMRNKIVTFAAQVANDARTWWGNVQVWWSETRNKIVSFAAQVVNDARTWWSNVQSWWSETRNKVVNFAAQVVNDARTWWSNVSAWWSGLQNKNVEFAARVINGARTWWGNVSAWWSELQNKNVEFAAKIANGAATWWNNVKTWWETEIEGKSLAEIVTNVTNKSAEWWSNVKTWWSTEIQGKSLAEIVTNVSNKSAIWWYNVKTWWQNTTAGQTVKDFIVNVSDKSSKWWTDVKTYWETATQNLSLGAAVDFFVNVGVKIAGKVWDGVTTFWEWLWGGGKGVEDVTPSLSQDVTITSDIDLQAGLGFDPSNTASDPTMWTLDPGIQHNLDNNSLKVPVDADPAWDSGGGSWWSRTFGNGSGLLSYLNIDNLSTDVSVGVKTAWNLFWGILSFLGMDNLSTTADVGVETVWDRWGQSLQQWIGMDNLDGTAYINVETVWSYWGYSLRKWLGLDDLSATVYVSTAYTASGGVFSGGKWSDIPQYASGTANAHGSLFIAGEAGPEVVGHIGGRTEVLNKSQLAATMFNAVRAAMSGVEIAASFYNGVDYDGDGSMMEYIQANNDAIERQNELLRQQNEYLRQLNEKDTTVEVTSNSIARGLYRQNRRAGTTVVPVGT